MISIDQNKWYMVKLANLTQKQIKVDLRIGPRKSDVVPYKTEVKQGKYV